MKKINPQTLSLKALTASFVLVLLAQVLVPLFPQKASAGVLTYGEVRLDRMKASTATTGTVCAKTNATVQTEAAVAVTFPTGFTVGAFGTWTVGTTATGWPKDPTNDTTAATAWPGISAPSGAGLINGQIVQFTSTDLTASTWYCFNWTSSTALTNPAAGNDKTGVITTCSASANCATTNGGGSGSNLDTSNWATSVITNDQISVTATVNPSFSFSLSSNAAALGTLSSSAPVAASAINASVSTNAQRGWNMWAADPAGTPGLTSATASKTLAYSPTVGSASAALSNGVEGYNLGAGTASGTTCTSVTTDPNFFSNGTSFKGGGLDNTLRTLAVADGVANACALPLTVNASISATTPAATDYSGLMTVVAAGRF